MRNPFQTYVSKTPFNHPHRKNPRRPLFLTISGIVVILLITVTYFCYLYKSGLSPVDPTDPNHRHYSLREIKACKENNDCPTLEKWLFDEAKIGHQNAVKALLKDGANPNIIVTEKWSALHIAILQNHEKVVKVLLAAGADVNFGSNDTRPDTFTGPLSGWTALHVVGSTGNERICKLLLKYGADITARSIQGFQPLFTAAEFGHEKIVEILLKAGAEVDARNFIGGTALHAASIGGYEKVIKILLAAGADVNTDFNVFYDGKYFNDGRTPLWLAVYGGKIKAVEILLASGAQTNATANGQTVLDISYQRSHEISEMLLAAGF